LSPDTGDVTEISADWVLPVDGPPIEGGLVRYEGGAVVEVTQGRAKRHHAGAAIVPGFVNAHSHLEYAMYAGFGDGQAFGPWIATHVERKNRLERDDMVAVARLGVLESLRAGIATTADYSFSGAAATAAAELGLRAIVYLEVFAIDPAQAERQFTEKLARVEEHGRGEAGLVRIGVSPHAPYSCSLDTYRWCLSLGIPVGTHLAESANENEWLEHGRGPLQGLTIVVPPTGKRAVATLEPVLGPDLLCAHCVEVNEDEIALLAERNVPIAHCPRSNALLGCGIAPVAELREADVRVGLGTDSPASTPSFDMFEEMRTAIYMARARTKRPEALLATDALRMATLDAARALRIEDQVGTLTPGKRADLTVVSLAGSPYHPVEDPAAAVVFGGSPERVLETIVDGHTRYANEDNEQWREVRSTASAARQRMLAPQR
jgi:cytosine/adenosine deaminase-related metal-dependent hydrolase